MEQTQAVLLQRQRRLFVEPDGASTAAQVRAFALELDQLGFVPSHRLQAALLKLSPDTLSRLLERTVRVLAEQLGSAQTHKPLYRLFPDGIPSDTEALWCKRVLVHYFQAADQPCLHCAAEGHTHVLSPCSHVVCDQCFDGSNYSGCPVCGGRVDRPSPFFKEPPVRSKGSWFKKTKPRRLLLIDLGDDLHTTSKALLTGLCARTQAMSPGDQLSLSALVSDLGLKLLPWLPDEIPVRENVAAIFGMLLRTEPAAPVLAAAEPYIKSATDILRMIAAYSDADVALAGVDSYTYFTATEIDEPRWAKPTQDTLKAQKLPLQGRVAVMQIKTKRFKVRSMSRALRRSLLGLLDAMNPDALAEDMLRHQSAWVGVGRGLHPGEYSRRFPNVAHAFKLVHKKAPDGTVAPKHRSYQSNVESALKAGAAAEVVALLKQRPGIFGRRLDHALRKALGASEDLTHVVCAFTSQLPELATPMLCTLRSHFRSRSQHQAARVFWPKGGSARAYACADDRALLPADVIATLVNSCEAELLERFAKLPSFERALVDPGLKNVIVPFAARGSSPSAVALPKGSRVQVPPGKTLRLFLHWCEPEMGGQRTDLDLSVGFYDADWNYRGVCSYYQLRCQVDGRDLATSAGDLTSAPFPAGSSEFIDLNREVAANTGVRYAVAVINSYAELPFAKLERAFAGLMLRDDVHGEHFDPQTVQLKFHLQGDNGVFLPMVVDLEQDTLTWMDLYSKGEFALNNEATSSTFIQQMCPKIMSYFASDVRPSMYELAAMHIAARCPQVDIVGGPSLRRGENESKAAFCARILAAGPSEAEPFNADVPVLAALLHGDVPLPDGSACYCLFDELAQSNLAAADFLSA